MRNEALIAAYESAKDRLPISEEQFLEEAKSWDVLPVKVGEEIVGAVLTKGEHIHACIKPQGFCKWLNKRVLKRTLFTTLAKYGRAVTSVESGNEIGRRFVERLGFTPFDERNGVTWYEVRHGN